MNDDYGQFYDFALHTSQKEGRFSYTCSWCGEVLLCDVFVWKKAFRVAIGAHIERHTSKPMSTVLASRIPEGGDR